MTNTQTQRSHFFDPRILIVLGAVLAGASGCAAQVAMASPFEDQRMKTLAAPPDQALVYLFRDEAFGGAIRMGVDMDGQRAGETGPKTYMVWKVPAGPHELTSHAENASRLPFVAQPGRTYYVWQEVKMGVLMARSRLEMVSESRGREGVASCQLVLMAPTTSAATATAAAPPPPPPPPPPPAPQSFAPPPPPPAMAPPSPPEPAPGPAAAPQTIPAMYSPPPAAPAYPPAAPPAIYQPAQPAQPPAPATAVPAYAPPAAEIARPAEPRAEHRHDGFFLRFGGGVAYASASEERTKAEITGYGGAGMFSLGFCPVENLVLHFDSQIDSATSPTLSVPRSKDTQLESALLRSLGAGVTYYWMPSNVFLSASLVATKGYRKAKGSSTEESDWGSGAALSLGKEWWVSENWGLGIFGRVLVARFADDSSRYTYTAAAISSGVSATFN